MIADAGLRPAASRLGSLLWGHALPACVMAVLLAARGVGLQRQVLHPPPWATPTLRAALVVRDVVTLAFLTLVVVLFVVRHERKGPKAPAWATLVAVGGTFLLIVPVSARIGPEAHGLLLVSTALVVGGTGFALAALATLGRCFGMRPAVRGLVTAGPYRWVRHPAYLGEIVFGLGWAVARWSWPAAGVFAAFCCLQYARALAEEQMLSAAFAEYGEYARRTPRLLPFPRPRLTVPR